MSRPIFLIGFILILCLPMIQMVTGFVHQPSVEENRQLAPVPVLKSWRTIDEYTRGAVHWFNDHYGFRDFLIRSKTQIDYSLFGMSTRIHIGSDGWLFYHSVVDIEQPNIERTLRTQADAVVEGTRQLAGALAARGVQLVIMIAPMKDVYYSRFLPSTVKPLPTPRQVDLLQERLKSMKEIVFIDSAAILQDVARQRNVFHRTDFHWNDPAAFEVARSLVDQIGKLEGRVAPVWTHPLEIEEKSFSGGEAAFMPIFFPPRERGLFVKQNWSQAPYNYTEKKPPFEWIYEMKEPTERQLPPIAVLGDSFFDGMVRSGAWIYFKKLYRANWNDTNPKELISNLPADCRYLFVEFIEVGNYGFTGLASERKAK